MNHNIPERLMGTIMGTKSARSNCPRLFAVYHIILAAHPATSPHNYFIPCKTYQNNGAFCRYITLYLYNISPYHKRKGVILWRYKKIWPQSFTH